MTDTAALKQIEIAARAILADWDERMMGDREVLKELDGHKYWSPKASAVSAEKIAALRAALSAQPAQDEKQYRFLKYGEFIENTDEFIAPDAQTWRVASSFIVGRVYCSDFKCARRPFLAAQPAQDGWQDISTAPRTGERILVFLPSYGAMSGHFDERWHCHSCINRSAQPILWQPLPSAPSIKGGE